MYELFFFVKSSKRDRNLKLIINRPKFHQIGTMFLKLDKPTKIKNLLNLTKLLFTQYDIMKSAFLKDNLHVPRKDPCANYGTLVVNNKII